ncbi:MAG TPA: hypothetical protein VM737_03110 [Gemmatimonadota bacterium]|nr:hypothetical protein [Gemmatimonadota bacterium]
MSGAEWAVTVAGAALIAFELWFFLGGRRARGGRFAEGLEGVARDADRAEGHH